MKKILLMSDTHGYLDNAILKYAAEVDEIWHAGDLGSVELCQTLASLKPFKAVYGNIDNSAISSMYPENLIFDSEGIRVLMTHIGGTPSKYPQRVKALIAAHQPQLFICGHSHILKVMFDQKNNFMYMNPGACGNQGFHQVKTLLKFEIQGAELKNLAVIELGKRTSLT